MKYIIFAFLFIASQALPIALMAKEHSTKHYLHHKLSKKDKRYPTFLSALQLIKERNLKTIIETGTSRCGDKNFEGDGGSTIIFAQWAKDYKSEFYSVDLSEENLLQAKSAVHNLLGKPNSRIHFVCSDSIAFLQSFGRQIDFLYLDSYDYEENNPLPSQHHHLFEIHAAYPYLTENSVVMIDDCDLPHGGKGRLAIEYLIDRGWKILENRYQVILIFPKN